MNQANIAVLFGGCNTEYEVSLQSAYSVITHIDREKYRPILIGITRNGEWNLFCGPHEKIKDDTWYNPTDCIRAIMSPDRETGGLLVTGKYEMRTIKIDAAMPVLHGKNGEDGTIQGLLQLAGIPIVGCDTLSSALCMDKVRAHKLAKAAGVDVANSIVISSEAEMPSALAHGEAVGYPLFVKPVKSGSSFGVTKVMCKDELPGAVKLGFEHDDEVIIEENIPGFEVGCAIIGSKELTIGEVDEIELAKGFFNYEEKYSLETSAIYVPARISQEKSEKVKHTAKLIYNALGCSGFARVDLFLTPTGRIVFNEVNTIPGFTTHSRFPNMLRAIGMTFEQVVNEVIRLAVESEA